MGRKIKLFMSHATEDKEEIALPLSEALKGDFDVWLDTWKMTAGDSLMGEIDKGIGDCDYAVVILSPTSITKPWVKAEVEAFYSKVAPGKKAIIPVWWQVSKQDVEKFSLIIASKLGIRGDLGITYIVDEIKRAVNFADEVKASVAPSWKAQVKALDAEIGHHRIAAQLSESVEGVRLAQAEAVALIKLGAVEAASFAEGFSNRQFRIENKLSHSFALIGPRGLVLHIHYGNNVTNSLCRARLGVRVLRERPYGHDQDEPVPVYDTAEYSPTFDASSAVVWKLDGEVSSSAAVLEKAFSAYLAQFKDDEQRDREEYERRNR